MAAILGPRSTKLRKRPNQERLKEIFIYDPETGFLQRRKPRKNRVAVGCCVMSSTGHYQVFADGALYQAHVIIWVLMTGEWPPHDIDHKNLIRTDNRWVNIRKASRSQNCANKAAHRDNTSGFKGVHKCGNRWRANIMKDYRQYRLGAFDTPEEAHAAYVAKARELFGEFARAV